MESKNVTVKKGIGFLPLLGLIFITLKLLGKITWPWIWVLVPLWGPIILVFLIFLIGLIVVVVAN